jgi:hypothetical protein
LAILGMQHGDRPDRGADVQAWGVFPRLAHKPGGTAVTFANALLGGFIANLVFSGDTGVQINHIISAFTETGLSLGSANFWARIPTNLVDKMIAVYTAFGACFFWSGGLNGVARERSGLLQGFTGRIIQKNPPPCTPPLPA